MNNSSGALSFDAIINDSDFQRKFDEMERRIKGFTNTATSETKKVDDQFRLLGTAIATYFTTDALKNVATQIITVRSEFQQLETAFRVMLGSKEKANALMSQVANLAAETPFGLKDVGNAVKMLIAYGTSADSAIKTLRMLGDVASGVSAPINDIVYLYGTLQTQGRAYAVDIQQFAGRGIPIYKELAKVLGTTQDKVKGFVEDGKVGFKEVEKAFQNMTSQGGLFNNAMLEQSKTIGGLISTLKDNIDQMFNDIGKNQEGFIAGTIKMGIDMTQNYEKILDVLTVLTAMYGAYRTALILTTAVESALIASKVGLTAAEALHYGWLVLEKEAQLALNAAMMANPYAIAAALLVGLAGSLYLVRQKSIELKSASELLSQANADVTSGVQAQSSEINQLIDVLHNKNIADSERLNAYNKINAITPTILNGLDFEKSKTADLTAEVYNYIGALEKKLRLEASQGKLKEALDQQAKAQEQFDKAISNKKSKSAFPTPVNMASGFYQYDKTTGANNRINDASKTLLEAKSIVSEINKSIETIYKGDTKDGLKSKIASIEAQKKGVDKLSLAYKILEEEGKKYTNQLDKIAEKENKGKKDEPVVKTASWYKNKIKETEELQSKVDATSKKYLEYQKQIDGYEKILNPTKSGGKGSKPEEIFPFGTIKYWEQVSQKAKEAIEKTVPLAERQRLNAVVLDADRKAEALRKELVIKSFDEELEEKKKQYDLYEKWVQFVSKESADAQFSTLIRSNKTYADWLKGQIDTLQNQQNSGMISEQGKKNLVSLNVEYASVTGGKSAIDVFKDGLEKAKFEAGSLSKYLAYLQTQQESLRGDTSTNGILKNLEIALQVNQTQQAIREELKSFLENANDYETQVLNIQTKYSNLRADLDAQYSDKKNETYVKTKELIKKAEEGELKDVNDIRDRNLESFKRLQETIYESNRQGLKLRIEHEKAALGDIVKKYGEQSKKYKEKAEEIAKLQEQLHKDTLTQINDFAALASQLGSVLQQAGGGFAQLGGLLSGLANSAKLITVSFDKSATTADKVQVGVSGIISLVNTLISASNQRNQAEKEYQNNALAFEHNYKMAINERIGLMASSEENVFLKNYQGRLTDSFKMFNDASAKYKEALAKLNQGQAKTGQQNSVNWGNVGSATGSGAAIGATVGSIVPVIGTAIGAGVGAVVGFFTGLFGAKTKDDTFGSLIQLYPNLITQSANGQKVFNKDLAQTLITNNQVDDATKQLLQNTIDWTNQMEKAKETVKGIISELAGNLGNNLRDSLVNAFKEGTDAAKAFGDSVSGILEDIISKMIFNQIFSKAFEDLEKEMIKSSDLANNGDGSWIDDFGNFFSQADGLWQQFYESLKTAQKEAGKYGLNIFQKTQTNTATNNTVLSGAIKGMSEETASILAGQFNAIRINSATTVQLTREGVGYLQNISKYSTQYLPYLEGIDAKLKTLNEATSLRAKGG